MVKDGNTGGGNELVVSPRALMPAQYQALADVPPELEWLANIKNKKTRRAYEADVAGFMAFAGLRAPAELRTVTRAHVSPGASISSHAKKDLKDAGPEPRCRVWRTPATA